MCSYSNFEALVWHRGRLHSQHFRLENHKPSVLACQNLNIHENVEEAECSSSTAIISGVMDCQIEARECETPTVARTKTLMSEPRCHRGKTSQLHPSQRSQSRRRPSDRAPHSRGWWGVDPPVAPPSRFKVQGLRV